MFQMYASSLSQEGVGEFGERVLHVLDACILSLTRGCGAHPLVRERMHASKTCNTLFPNSQLKGLLFDQLSKSWGGY